MYRPLATTATFLGLLFSLFFTPLFSLSPSLGDVSIMPQIADSSYTEQKDAPIRGLSSEEPSLPDVPPSYRGAFAKMMLSLFGLIALIIFCAWTLRKLASGRLRQINQGKAIKILERRPLSPKSILYLVEVSGKKILMAESQIEIRTLATLDTLPSVDTISDES